MPIYNKLVRDKIPKIIQENGETCKIIKLDPSTYFQKLKVKLKEELNEYLQAENDEDSVKELADILEIIYSLSVIHGKGFEEIEAARQKKLIERGGFKEKIFLIEISKV
ncbi:phosphoribosyl-ATP pyrophosphohydrolase [Scopulibacillus cellulosilyticus]|uniref:Phosphoribosyl-ATP pyrophosphohydrolase n=1 Tax=Scopulibacillus cellulosilyticus TaxID=2665665 RepID=A0ABW2PU13_9BACL